MFPFLAGNMTVRKMRDGEFRFLSSWTHVSASLRRSDGTIEMFKYLADPSKATPLWIINMRDVVVDIRKGDDPAVRCKETLPEFCLLIMMPNEKAFCCEIEDGIQLNQWISCLSFVLGMFRGRPSRRTADWIWTECGLDPTDPGNTQEKYIWEGYLEKHGSGSLSLWNKRYVCVTENYLTYFDNHKVKNHRYAERLRIPLGEIITVSRSSHTDTIFELLTKSRLYEFAASSNEECRNWIRILNGKIVSTDDGGKVVGPELRKEVGTMNLHESCVHTMSKSPRAKVEGASEREREVLQVLADAPEMQDYRLDFSPLCGDLKSSHSGNRTARAGSPALSPRSVRRAGSTPRGRPRSGSRQVLSENDGPRRGRSATPTTPRSPRTPKSGNSGLALTPDLDMSLSLSTVKGNSFRHEGGTITAPGKLQGDNEGSTYDNLAEDYRAFIESRRSLMLEPGKTPRAKRPSTPGAAAEESCVGSRRKQVPKKKYLTISVSIPDVHIDGAVHEIVDGKNMPVDELFIVYNVRVKVGGHPAWSMPCRYERFEEYHRNMDHAISSKSMPVFPSNGIFSKVPKGAALKKFVEAQSMDDRMRSKSQSFGERLEENPHVDQRRLQLQEFLQEVLSFPGVLQIGYTRKLLGLNDPKHLIDSEQKLEQVVKSASSSSRTVRNGGRGCCASGCFVQ